MADRKEAIETGIRRRQEEEKSLAPTSESGTTGTTNQSKVLTKKITAKARQNIFSNWNKWAIADIDLIEFAASEEPLLKLGFTPKGKGPDAQEFCTIRFLDDVARERWRRGLAYILNKSDTAAQW